MQACDAEARVYVAHLRGREVPDRRLVVIAHVDDDGVGLFHGLYVMARVKKQSSRPQQQQGRATTYCWCDSDELRQCQRCLHLTQDKSATRRATGLEV
jgi:hypothetical protein